MNQFIEKINDLSQDYDVYVVGGFARDLFLKYKNYNDIDLCVNGNALKYSKIIANAFKTKVVILNDVNETYRIILKDNIIGNIDVSAFCGKTIKSDLCNRDFTINAIAFNLKNYKSFKKHVIFSDKNTLRDLNSRILNTVSIDAFKSDPLRMLRGFRFSAIFNFKFSKKTLEQIKQNAKHIRKVAPERVKNELFKIFCTENSANLIDEMDKCGLLIEIFPEIKNMKRANKKYYYHAGGLFQHSFETLKSIEHILNNLYKYFPENYKDIKKDFNDNTNFSENITRKSLLKFVALFHDNAKPDTVILEKGKMRFWRHEEYGANKIKKIMIPLKFGKKDIEYAMSMIKYHMRPSTLTKNKIITKRAMLKLFRDIGKNTADLFILSMADWYSYQKLKSFSYKKLIFQEKSIKKLLKNYYKLKNAKPLTKIIDGHIIMQEFNLSSGPWIGDILKIITEAQHENKIFNTSEALKLISLILTDIKKKYTLDEGIN
ncbi:MAG: HD domain-containing protein [Endomicrobium sp.]|nr:HD domain-containing protein [Endomicrobium sp.]